MSYILKIVVGGFIVSRRPSAKALLPARSHGVLCKDMKRESYLWFIDSAVKPVNGRKTCFSVILPSRVGKSIVASMHFDYEPHHTVTVCKRSPTKSLSNSSMCDRG